jgi:hypothetical protein
VQVVSKLTRRNCVLDKFCTNRLEVPQFDMFTGLIKTKHTAVCVELYFGECRSCVKTICKKLFCYDLRQYRVDMLRYCLGVYDWSGVL